MAALTDRLAFSGHPLADSPADAPHTFDTESVVCLYRPRADWPDPALSGVCSQASPARVCSQACPSSADFSFRFRPLLPISAWHNLTCSTTTNVAVPLAVSTKVSEVSPLRMIRRGCGKFELEVPAYHELIHAATPSKES